MTDISKSVNWKISPELDTFSANATAPRPDHGNAWVKRTTHSKLYLRQINRGKPGFVDQHKELQHVPLPRRPVYGTPTAAIDRPTV